MAPPYAPLRAKESRESFKEESRLIWTKFPLVPFFLSGKRSCLPFFLQPGHVPSLLSFILVCIITSRLAPLIIAFSLICQCFFPVSHFINSFRCFRTSPCWLSITLCDMNCDCLHRLTTEVCSFTLVTLQWCGGPWTSRGPWMIRPSSHHNFKIRLDMWVAECPMYLEVRVGCSWKNPIFTLRYNSFTSKIRSCQSDIVLLCTIGSTGWLFIFVIYYNCQWEFYKKIRTVESEWLSLGLETCVDEYQ